MSDASGLVQMSSLESLSPGLVGGWGVRVRLVWGAEGHGVWLSVTAVDSTREADSQRAGLRGTRRLVIQEPHWTTTLASPREALIHPQLPKCLLFSPPLALLPASLLLSLLLSLLCCCSGLLSDFLQTSYCGARPRIRDRDEAPAQQQPNDSDNNKHKGRSIVSNRVSLHRPESPRRYPKPTFPTLETKDRTRKLHSTCAYIPTAGERPSQSVASCVGADIYSFGFQTLQI